jgi:hypothetical protein
MASRERRKIGPLRRQYRRFLDWLWFGLLTRDVCWRYPDILSLPIQGGVQPASRPLPLYLVPALAGLGALPSPWYVTAGCRACPCTAAFQAANVGVAQPLAPESSMHAHARPQPRSAGTRWYKYAHPCRRDDSATKNWRRQSRRRHMQ